MMEAVGVVAARLQEGRSMMRFLFTLSLLFGLPIRSVAAGVAVGIPRTGYCNTSPYHARETLTFPTTSTGTKVCTFTIPAYGRGVRTIDTNGDTVPDIPPACGDVTRNSGDPLTGFGMERPVPSRPPAPRWIPGRSRFRARPGRSRRPSRRRRGAIRDTRVAPVAGKIPGTSEGRWPGRRLRLALP
jgi:hypothetical protein